MDVPMKGVSTLFPPSYEESRARFRRDLDLVRQLWPDAQLGCHRLQGEEDLTIDWIEAQAVEKPEQLLLFTTGEHGIEAYAGSAMLQLFLEEFLSRLAPERTGLLLVHAINPWGMKHRRRANGRNVDLNRNFFWNPRSLDPSLNPDYERLDSFLNPRGPISSLFLANLSFLLKLLWNVLFLGPQRFRQATLLGQYRFPKGLYYGGESIQEETRVFMDLYRDHVQVYEHIVHLDMHTGYGPRYQMSIVNSWMEPKDSAERAREFRYPMVVKSSLSEFYCMLGDMIDCTYTLVQNELPEKRLYATSFEFGALGDSFSARVRSLRTLVLENRMHWFGARNQRVRQRIAREFQEMFVPSEDRWRTKAVADARQAFEGVLRAEGFISQ